MLSLKRGCASIKVVIAVIALLPLLALPSFSYASDITGDVRSAQGTPEAGVQVTCTDASGKVVGQATTNSAGRYCISGLTPGTYTCSTSAPAPAGLQGGASTVNLPDEGLTDNWSLSSGAAAISSANPPGVCAAGLFGLSPVALGLLGVGAVAGISMGICASLGCISDSSPQRPVTGTK